MALASPRYRPYVHSPGANPAAARRYANAASQFYPAVYGGGPATTATAQSTQTDTTTAPATQPVDYQALLANDPILGQALAGYKASDLQNLAGLQAAQQRALVQYGRVPSMTLPGLSGVDETTRQLAAQNTGAGTSTVAGLDRAYKLAQQGSDASLAARGILRSGAYGQHAAENLQGYQQAGYQADQQLLDYLQGLYSSYLQQQQALQQSGVGATNDAWLRIVEQIKAGLIGNGGNQPPAPPPPSDQPPPAAFPNPVGTVTPDPFQWVRGKVGTY